MEFDVPIINVGNIIAGGSGKTPMIEYLVEKYGEHFSIATLSRGYGRKSRGFRIASEQDTAETIGDEPFQFYQKYGDRIVVTVGEERALAIPEILFHHPEVNLILLDDAFQHRYVKPTFNILVTEYSRPFFKDYILPMGLLRESRHGAKRADAVVVSKCPSELSTKAKNEFYTTIGQYAPEAPVFYATIEYGKPSPEIELNKNNRVIALTGVGNPAPFEEYLKDNFNVVDVIRFRDHHQFNEGDIRKIIAAILKYEEEVVVLTTEKDYGRLRDFLPVFSDKRIKISYLPIRYSFLFDENKFDKMISDAIIAVQRENIE